MYVNYWYANKMEYIVFNALKYYQIQMKLHQSKMN